MSRAERRRSAREEQKKQNTYVLTQAEIDDIKRQATEVATRRAFLMFMAIPVMVLHDKFGFRKQRLGRFMDYAMVWFESIHNNETKLQELVKIAEAECGIQVLNHEGEKK